MKGSIYSLSRRDPIIPSPQRAEELIIPRENVRGTITAVDAVLGVISFGVRVVVAKCRVNGAVAHLSFEGHIGIAFVVLDVSLADLIVYLCQEEQLSGAVKLTVIV